MRPPMRPSQAPRPRRRRSSRPAMPTPRSGSTSSSTSPAPPTPPRSTCWPTRCSELELQDVGGLGVDPALDHLEVGALDGFEPVAVDDLEPAVDPLAERMPGVRDPGLQARLAPLGGALH